MDSQHKNTNPEGSPDGGQKGEGGAADASSQGLTPEQWEAKYKSLETDTFKERERRKTAETALKTADTKRQIEDAKTAEELAALKKTAEADIAGMRRTADLKVAAAAKGIHDAFLTESDDGESTVEDVIRLAEQKQKTFLDAKSKEGDTIKMGGGSSPDGKGGKIWKASEVAALDPVEFRKHEKEILQAQKDGRYRPTE